MVATTTDVEMTEVDVSTAMTVEDDLSETIEADDLSAIIVVTTAVIGIAPSATTTISLSDRNATDAVSQEEAAVAVQTTEGSNAVTTDAVATDLVAMTDAGATEEGTTVAAERCSTTTTGIALNATTPISHSVRNATDVDCLEAVVNPVLVETIGVVATEVAAMIDAAAADLVAMTEEVAMTDVVATEEVAMTDVVATADRLAVNLGNSVKLVERDQAMLTTDHLVI